MSPAQLNCWLFEVINQRAVNRQWLMFQHREFKFLVWNSQRSRYPWYVCTGEELCCVNWLAKFSLQNCNGINSCFGDEFWITEMSFRILQCYLKHVIGFTVMNPQSDWIHTDCIQYGSSIWYGPQWKWTNHTIDPTCVSGFIKLLDQFSEVVYPVLEYQTISQIKYIFGTLRKLWVLEYLILWLG